MAFTTEAYYEQTTNNGVVDKIEIQQDGGTSRNIQLQADASRNGFKWRLSEITSDSDDGLINPLANKIQEGKLTFYPRIDTTAKETLLNNIIDSPDSEFRVVWKQKQTGGTYSTKWTGNVDNKMRTYPEKGGSYFAVVRANDFDLLKTTDYALDDTRQTLITTIADLLGTLNFGLSIRTATSWITENTTDTTDFLSQIYHETKALREFSRTGQETDQPISVWDALTHVGDPALLFRQVNGEFTVEQLSEFDDPTTVHETLYNPDGTVNTATTTVDRTLNADKSIDSGDLVVTRGSQNDRYPAVKRASVQFQHRTEVSRVNEISFDLDDSTVTSDSESQTIISDGDQTIRFSFFVLADTSVDAPSSTFSYVLKAGTYYWDQANYLWTENGGVELTNDVDLTKTTDKPGLELWIGNNSYLTDNLPSDADGLLTVKAYIPTNMENASVNTRIFINNAQAAKDSKYINFQLTQSNGYTTNFDLGTTWFGDGPVPYSPSALRYGTGDGDITQDSWQRRGTTTGYRNFQKNLLKEILDLQRSNVRKLNANFWGSYDPSKILVYDAENFYCAGVSYSGHLGRWSANLFRINIQTATDDFDDIPKFADESSTGTSSTEDSTSTGGGINQSTADARYFNESELLGEIATADIDTALTNLGLKDGSRDLDLNSLSINGAAITATPTEVNILDGATLSTAELNQLDGNVFTSGITGTTADFSGALDADTLRTDTGKFLSPTSYQFRNAGDTAFRSAQMAGLTATTGVFSGDVGIGTSSPATTLHLRDTSANFSIQSDNGQDSTIVFGDAGDISEGEIRYTSTDNMIFKVNNLQESLRLLDNGDGRFSHNVFVEGNAIAHSDVREQNYTRGWIADGGRGFSIYQDSSATTQWNAEFNDLLIRGRLKVFELIVKQIAVLGGTEILSVAVAEADSVSGTAGSETVSITDPRNFGGTSLAANDLVIVQRVDLNDTTVVKQEFRTVSSITGTDVTFTSTSGAPAPSDAIEPGDIMVAYGNTTDTARQNIMYRGVEGELVSRFQTGVDSYADFNSPGATSNLIMGDLTDAQTLSNGTTPSGFGFYAKGSAYLEGEIVASSGEIGGTTILSEHLSVVDKVFIGDDLSNNEPLYSTAGTIGIGPFTSGQFPRIRIVGQGGASDNLVQLLADDGGGTMFNIRANTNDIVNISDTEAKFFGAFVDDTGLWAGGGATSNPATKSDSNIWLDFTNGRIYYDALVVPIYTRTEIASLNSSNPSNASSTDDDIWIITITASSTGTTYQTESVDIINANYPHLFGIDAIEIIGVLDSMQVGAGDEGRCRLQISIDGNTQTTTLHTIDNTAGGSSTTDTNIAIDESFDISGYSLTPNTVYEVTVTILSDARSSDGDQLCKSDINENLTVFGTTG